MRQCQINGVIYEYDACYAGSLKEAKKCYPDMVYMGYGNIISINGVRQRGLYGYHLFRFKNAMEVIADHLGTYPNNNCPIPCNWFTLTGTQPDKDIWRVPTEVDYDKLNQFKNSNMKIKKQIEKLEGVELVQKVDKEVLIVYLKEKAPKKKDIIKEAISRGFVLGATHSGRCGNRARFTIDRDLYFIGDCLYGGDSGCIFNGETWAEIIKPLFKTEDGVDIYEGDIFYVVRKNEFAFLEWDKNISDRPLSTRQFCASKKTLKEDNELFFSSEAAARAWIDTHQPLELVEGEIYTVNDACLELTWIFRFKKLRASEEGTAHYWSMVGENMFELNDWITYDDPNRTCCPSSLEEKKKLITAEVNNGYFHKL